jgi:regulator of replication initiation timing
MPCCASVHLQVSADKATLDKELAKLQATHKQVAAAKAALEEELTALKPAHAQLQAAHTKATTELQTTQASLQKSEAARVYAEVRRMYHETRLHHAAPVYAEALRHQDGPLLCVQCLGWPMLAFSSCHTLQRMQGMRLSTVRWLVVPADDWFGYGTNMHTGPPARDRVPTEPDLPGA